MHEQLLMSELAHLAMGWLGWLFTKLLDQPSLSKQMDDSSPPKTPPRKWFRKSPSSPLDQRVPDFPVANTDPYNSAPIRRLRGKTSSGSNVKPSTTMRKVKPSLVKQGPSSVSTLPSIDETEHMADVEE